MQANERTDLQQGMIVMQSFAPSLSIPKEVTCGAAFHAQEAGLRDEFPRNDTTAMLPKIKSAHEWRVPRLLAICAGAKRYGARSGPIDIGGIELSGEAAKRYGAKGLTAIASNLTGLPGVLHTARRPASCQAAS